MFNLLTMLTVEQSCEILQIQIICGRHYERNGNKASFYTLLSLHTFYFTYNKTADIIKQNRNQFLLVVQATALKKQMSKFYPKILSREATFYVGPESYDRDLRYRRGLISTTISCH